MNEGRIHDLECRLDKRSQEVTRVVSQHDNLKSDIRQLKSELNVIEQYSRRNCVRIFGLKELSNEDTNVLIKELTQDKLGVNLQPTFIDRSHRLGKPDSKGCRAIIVKFTNHAAKDHILKARRKLKGSGTVIKRS